MNSQHINSMMSMGCQEELQGSRGALTNLQQPQMTFSPQKHHSFNLPLKIKIDPKMAAQFASGIDKESPPHLHQEQEMRPSDSLSQDMNPCMHTPMRGPRSFLQQFSHSDGKGAPQAQDDELMRIAAVGKNIRDQEISQGKDRKLFFRGGNAEKHLFLDDDKDAEPQILSQLTNRYDSQHPISVSEHAHQL